MGRKSAESLTSMGTLKVSRKSHISMGRKSAESLTSMGTLKVSRNSISLYGNPESQQEVSHLYGKKVAGTLPSLRD
jgi:hypothetical protein